MHRLTYLALLYRCFAIDTLKDTSSVIREATSLRTDDDERKLIRGRDTTEKSNTLNTAWIDNNPVQTQPSKVADSFIEQKVTEQISPGSTTTTGWLERLKNSLIDFICGLVLIIFSTVFMWVNERRAAAQNSFFSNGAKQCEDFKGIQDQNVQLVHVSGQTTAEGTLEDPEFKEISISNAARLRRRSRIFQWVKHERTETEDNFGGSETETKKVWYEKEWSDNWVNCTVTNFDNGTQVTGLHEVQNASKVMLLGASLNSSQVQRLCNWTLIEPQSPCTALGKDFEVIETKDTWDGSEEIIKMWYAGKGTPENPEIGDVQMKIEQVKCGDATVVTLFHRTDDTSSFLPYRPVDVGVWSSVQGLFGQKKDTRAMEEEKLIEAAQSDKVDYWSCSILCCVCNLVEYLFGMGGLRVEIDYIAEKIETKEEAFRSMQEAGSAKTTMLRFGSWLGLYIGLVMMFSPIITLLKVLPFLASLGSVLVYIFAFFVTVAWALVVIAMAYVVYRPLLATAIFVVVGAIVFFLSHGQAAGTAVASF